MEVKIKKIKQKVYGISLRPKIIESKQKINDIMINMVETGKGDDM
jgi:hypothetical protein